MPTPAQWREPAAWAALARRHTVTVWNSAPALLKMFVDYVEQHAEFQPLALHLAILGGDWVPVSLPDRVKAIAPEIRVIVLGGATEASIHSIIFPVEKVDPSWKSIPYGVPQWNQKAYILNSALQPSPIGVPGELFLGGIGLGRGYFQRVEQTNERFLPSPFVPGERIYRTGDLARYRTDGVIELLGRIDYQVKLRGMRIECGEIEAVLRRHSGVREAVVVAQGDAAADKRLVAYLRPDDVAACLLEPEASGSAVESNGDRLIEDLRSFAQTKLPDYMVPSAFVLVPELPLSPNGKVDRKALAATRVVVRSKDVVRPHGADEQTIAEIFRSVLGLTAVSANDSFFHIGGHSLLAAQVVSRMGEAFGVEVPLRTIFERPTVAELASAISETAARGTRTQARPPLVPAPRDSEVPLGFVQEGLWFLDGLLQGTSAYNIAPSFRLTGKLDHAVLDRALAEIVRRHEILRTTLLLRDEHPVQIIAPTHCRPLRIVDLRDVPADERAQEAMRLADAESRLPFDLSRGPLFRATLLQIDDCDHLLSLVVHHAIADGVSFEVLGQELDVLYEAYAAGLPSPLPALTIQFADYAMWERQWLREDVLEELNTFWATELAGAPSNLELPTDHTRPALQTLHGARHFFDLSHSRSDAVDQLCRTENVTAFMTLLAAFDVLLFAYAGADDIVVGAPFANRLDPATQNLIGVFVNTLPLRTRMSSRGSFRSLLAQVRETVLKAQTHQSLPLEKIVQAVRPARDLSRNPLFQVDFRMRPTASPFPFRLQGIASELVVSDAVNSKFDLALELWFDGVALKGFLEYSTDLFEADTIRRLARAFDRLVAVLLARADTPIQDLEIVEDIAEIGREVVGRQSVAIASSLTTAVRQAKRRGVTVKEERISEH
jgi:acyl carrier protein